MKDKTIGFLGLGSMGVPMCHGLQKSGYQMIIPAYRKEEDANSGYSPLVPDRDSKLAAMDEMVRDGAIPAASMRELVAGSDVILISMPTSRQVEFLVLSEEGILRNARPGTVVIDLTTADPSSTRRLAAQLEEKGIDLLDAPISAVNQVWNIPTSDEDDNSRDMLELVRMYERWMDVKLVGIDD